MVEFICLSNRPVFHQSLAASIPLAMGDLSPWNLTLVDAGQFDLFSGYNHGAKQTRGEILVFVHDDVRFLGNPLTFGPPLKALEETTVGFIGVAGTRLLERHGCWWGYNQSQEVLDNCRGITLYPSDAEFATEVWTWPKAGALFDPVVVLDGVLLMCHRRTFEKLGGFDDQNYKGNHFYDVDITFRATMARLVNHTAPIPLMHFTTGQVNDDWERNRQVFLREFGHLLPARLG